MFKKIMIATCILAALITGIFMAKKHSTTKQADHLTIGILQTASHPALDQSRDGFMQHLQQTLGSNVSFVIQNAEGSMSHAQAIAKSFHLNKQIDGIFAIATPAVQAIAHVEKTKPIFFAAVSDPHALGLMHQDTNACGATDLVNVTQQIDGMLKLLPHLKIVALLFNPSEINSVSCVKKQEESLHKHGITTLNIGVATESEVPIAVQKAARSADAILIPTDNTMASALSIIASLALKAKKPVIVSDNLLVDKGALLAAGSANYHLAGKKAAELAISVLIGHQKPSTLPLASSIDARIFVNKKVAEELEISIPAELHHDIVWIE